MARVLDEHGALVELDEQLVERQRALDEKRGDRGADDVDRTLVDALASTEMRDSLHSAAARVKASSPTSFWPMPA